MRQGHLSLIHAIPNYANPPQSVFSALGHLSVYQAIGYPQLLLNQTYCKNAKQTTETLATAERGPDRNPRTVTNESVDTCSYSVLYLL